ncbi:MAG: hypothetical protein IJT91_03630 [Clostridia bacterium]|nr:hypothetical protein [Clostridia bacterium]
MAKDRPYPALFDRSSDPVIVCDREHKIVYKNASAVRSIPRPRKGSCILNFVSPGDRTKLLGGNENIIFDLRTENRRFGKALEIRTESGSVVIFPLFLQRFPESVFDAGKTGNGMLDDYIRACRSFYADLIISSPAPAKTGSRILNSTAKAISKLGAKGDFPMEQSLAAAISDISAVGAELSRKCNCRLNVDIKGGAFDGRVVSGIHFSYTVVRLLSFAIALSSDGAVDLIIKDGKNRVSAELSCGSDPELYRGRSGKGSRFLAGLFPSGIQTVAELECLIGCEGWELSCGYAPESRRFRAILRLPDRSKDSNRLFVDDGFAFELISDRVRSALREIFGL